MNTDLDFINGMLRETADDWPERDSRRDRNGSMDTKPEKVQIAPMLDANPQQSVRPKLIFHDAWEASFKPKPLKECIIEGMLRRGEVGNVIASTKTGKSWFGLMLLLSVATGKDWLGRCVARGPVLLIDNELHEETIENRLSAVRDKMNIRHDTHMERFEYVACRGNWVSLIELMEQVRDQYQPGELNLIVIDAKYRLFGEGLQENSNDDQTTFHNMCDRFAKEMDCPILLIHHATKGNQTTKSVTDVGSGGGSQARAVDLHLILRPHEQEGLAVLEAAVRSFAPVEPVSLQWKWPLWSVAHDIEPALKAEKTRGDSKQEAKDAAGIDDLKKILAKSTEPLSRNAMRNAFGGGKDRLNRLIRLGLEEGAFAMAGTKEAQNGVVAELFTIASKEDSNVQRSVSTV